VFFIRTLLVLTSYLLPALSLCDHCRTPVARGVAFIAFHGRVVAVFVVLYCICDIVLLVL